MALNNIDEMLDCLRRIKSRGDMRFCLRIMRLEAAVRLLRTLIKHHHDVLPDSLIEIRKKIKNVVELFHMGEIKDVSWDIYRLLKYIEDNNTLRYNYDLNASSLSEYMDCLGANLNDVLKYKSNHRLLKQVKIVQKKMRFLRYLYAMEINGNIDHEKVDGLETRIQFLTDNVGQFCLGFWVRKIKWFLGYVDGVEEYIRSKPNLLCLAILVELEMQRIFRGILKHSKFCQAKTFKYHNMPKDFSDYLHRLLTYLRNTKLENFPNDVSTRNMDEAIEFLLFFLADVPNRFNDAKMLNEALKKVGAIVGDVLFVIQKLLPNSMVKGDISKVNLCLIPIVEETDNLKAQEEKYYKSLKFTCSHEFPAFGGLSFLDSLLRKLNEILVSGSSLNFMMKPHIGILEKKLSSLTSIFRDVAKLHEETDFFKDCQRRTVNLAYEVEVSVDSILAQCNSLWHIFCSLPTILKEIKHISEEVIEMSLKNLPPKLCSMVEPSPTPYIDSTDEDIVGFENDAEKIIQYLIGGTKDRNIIPIVGMGGQGKTTIARKVYDNIRSVSRFDVRVWCCISQTYSRRELLQDIFNQVTGYKVDKVDELADKLRKSLMGKRYLIVLDDMWDGTAWDDLCLSFPDGENGSRIIVTTRLKDVGEHVKHHTDPYSLPFLTTSESLQLLQKKVFQNESCPPELQNVSLEVAERCKGLPLSVVLVSGIIKRKKTEASWWLEVKDSLLSHFGESEEYSPSSTLQLSYDYLPDYLRPCLLYMGMFPEDERVPVAKLINLWIAEGFVQNIGSGKLEEAAEGYLMDLISSNVIMVSKKAYNCKVKYCQVHDVVLQFCLERIREEKFMLAVKGHRSQFKPCSWKAIRLNFNFTAKLSEIALLVPKAQNPYHQQLRSLITTSDEFFFYHGYVFPFPQVIKLRLLRVLDLSSRRLVEFPSATLNPLIHLKYLAVDTDHFDFHPELLLLNLETMILKNREPILLPEVFWKMKKLRHVDIPSGAKFDLKNNKQKIMEESSKLENLRTLSRVVRFTPDMMDVLSERCPNLEKLDISVYGCTSLYLKKFESLTHLNLHSTTFSSELNFPSNLKKLVVECPQILSTASLIVGLPNLEYLKLEGGINSSEKGCLKDMMFGQLKVLKLSRLCMSTWDASETSFPMLERLVIDRCHDLDRIPLSFADISTLKQIKLIHCNRWSLQASVREIKKEVEDNEGCDRIDAIIDGFIAREYPPSEESEEESDYGRYCSSDYSE